MSFKLTVGRKLFGMSGLALCFLFAVGAAGYQAAAHLSASAESLLTDTSALKNQLQADMAHDALRADVLAALLAAAEGATDRQREVEGELKDHLEQFTGALQRLEALPLEPAARQAVAGVRPVLDEYVAQAKALVALAFSDRAAAAARMERFKQSFKEVETQMAALSDVLAQRSERSQSNLAASELASRHARLGILVTLAIAAALMLAVSWATSRGILAKIRSAVEVAERVADGDLRSRVDVQGSDETAQLLAALGTMNDGLARLVGTVRDASESIATGTAQIAIGNQDLSQRTEEQASSLQQTAASMEQMSASVRSSAAATRKASGLAGTATRSVGSGEAAVAQLVATMGAITEASRRITEITSVIDGIAFQTNILALNAAVEAARAGEGGRGFAVVAGEVRVLAQRSAAAAREIKQLIDATVQKVSLGEQHASHAGHAMQEMTGTVREMSELITEINMTNEEQSKGIAEISQAVTNIDQTTQKNASLVEEAAAAAESLRQQAIGLVQAVARFSLGAGTAAAPALPQPGRT